MVNEAPKMPGILVAEEDGREGWAPMMCGAGYVTVQDEEAGEALINRFDRLDRTTGRFRIRRYVPNPEHVPFSRINRV